MQRRWRCWFRLRCILLVVAGLTPAATSVLCKYVPDESSNSTVDELLMIDNDDVVVCQSGNCYALWRARISLTDDFTYDELLLQKGCWNNIDKCEVGPCIANRAEMLSTQHLNRSMFFCCCRGHLCNANPSYVTQTTNLTATAQTTKRLRGFIYAGTFVWLFACLFGMFALFVAAAWFAARRRRLESRKEAVCSIATASASPSAALCHDAHWQSLIDAAAPSEEIGRGRFGRVRLVRESALSRPLAVKSFGAADYAHFRNEADVYALLRRAGGHANLLECLTERDDGRPPECPAAVDGSACYWLVTNYMAGGNLQELLKSRTLHWSEFLQMSLDVASGLAFLHQANGSKPAIAHRDMSSRNVLVSASGLCAVADLSLAVPLVDGQPLSMSEVGTLRYLAPEILEGAVNLHDPATSLKQIDVYAMGIVLWEAFSRCADIWRRGAAYESPFSHEVAAYPTREQMQEYVAKRRVRPDLPVGKLPSEVSFVCELIGDCWDHDAEARISAVCAAERVSSAASGAGTRRPVQRIEWVASDGTQPYQGRNPCEQRNVLPTLPVCASTWLFAERGARQGSNSSSTSRVCDGASGNKLWRSPFAKVDPCDASSLTAHLLGKRRPQRKAVNEPSEQLIALVAAHRHCDAPHDAAPLKHASVAL